MEWLLLVACLVIALAGCALVIGGGTATATSGVERKIKVEDSLKVEDVALPGSAADRGKLK
jgi:hypothetical protein